MTIEIVVGLPHLGKGALLERARTRRYPVLVSANALSRWDRRAGYPVWQGWNYGMLANAAGLRSVDLDSAGFVLASRYRGIPWSTDAYIALAASFPFRRFASLDLCVEAEIAHDRDEVLDRMARTVALNHACHARAADAGILDSFMPVIQGRRPDDYLRSLDGIAGILRPGIVIGVGSTCRRALHGDEGLIAVFSALDQALGSERHFLHGFGIKGTALTYLAPLADRLISIDSQAFNLAARIEAHKHGHAKTNAFVADHMDRWTGRQRARLKTGHNSFQHQLQLTLPAPQPASPWDAALAQARAEIRDLLSQGEISHDQITDNWVAQWASDLLDEKPDFLAQAA